MPKKAPKTYTQMSAELTGILEWFETADVDLDEAMAKYQQATQLIAEMEDYLKTATNKIKKISSAG